ncbi:MAG: response regulator [Deltaproteobacteria bacterium]|nr:response regulator [Deltaproteobacteria bacterium]
MRDDRIRVVVVDDEESIRRGLKAWLEDEDFEVETVGSGEAALEILSSRPADGAIVDIRLPGMDGNAFMEQAHQMCPGMKFLVYTGSVDYAPLPQLRAMGISDKDIFQKPLRDMAVLVAAMKDRIERQRQ